MRTVGDTVAGTKPPAVTCTRAFAGSPESVSAARSWVAGFFPDLATAADAALMTSELVTNAIQHSASRLPGGQVTVSVQTGDGTVRVDVIDQGQLPPRFPRCSGLGQGLALVAALADASGTDGRGRWFSLRTANAVGLYGPPGFKSPILRLLSSGFTRAFIAGRPLFPAFQASCVAPAWPWPSSGLTFISSLTCAIAQASVVPGFRSGSP
jgi:serine/threonine-protein kinase RsbW